MRTAVILMMISAVFSVTSTREIKDGRGFLYDSQLALCVLFFLWAVCYALIYFAYAASR